MPKLPENLVKPPVSAFDNPLRRTVPATRIEASEVSEALAGGSHTAVVIPIALAGGPNHISIDSNRDDATAVPPRITVRIDDDIRRALETECHKRRLAGEKTNVAEVARRILTDWATR